MGRQKRRSGRCCDDDDDDYNFYCGDKEPSCDDDYCQDFEYTEC